MTCRLKGHHHGPCNNRCRERLPVIFRAERSGDFKGDVTAVFPTLDGAPGEMTCYAHIGQHSACNLDWYYSTRPAKPNEYEALLAELRGIYESELDAVRLVVYKRRVGAAA